MDFRLVISVNSRPVTFPHCPSRSCSAQPLLRACSDLLVTLMYTCEQPAVCLIRLENCLRLFWHSAHWNVNNEDDFDTGVFITCWMACNTGMLWPIRLERSLWLFWRAARTFCACLWYGKCINTQLRLLTFFFHFSHSLDFFSTIIIIRNHGPQISVAVNNLEIDQCSSGLLFRLCPIYYYSLVLLLLISSPLSSLITLSCVIKSANTSFLNVRTFIRITYIVYFLGINPYASFTYIWYFSQSTNRIGIYWNVFAK